MLTSQEKITSKIIGLTKEEAHMHPHVHMFAVCIHNPTHYEGTS